jgi:hypothetical protein
MKPNFIVIGAQKCGTTTLCRELERHPQVAMFPNKETHFFSFRYGRGLEWYEGLFDGLEGDVVGEGSPSYTTGEFSALAAERIASDLPLVKLIFIARHPLHRLPSGYVQLFDSDLNPGTFEEELERSPKLIPASCFHARLEEYKSRFPADSLHVMFLEDLKDDYQGELARLFEFIGVDPSFAESPPLAPQNTRAHKRVDRGLLRQARKSGSFLSLNWAIPRTVKRSLIPLFRKKVDVDVSWTQELHEYAVERIREDAECFLKANGKPRDFWGWEQG